MKRPHSRFQALARAVRLRCPGCGVGPLFSGPFTMAPECSRCGYSYQREPGFYFGSIYINYGVTAVGTILLYALMVLGLGTTHEIALAVSLVVAVMLPVLFFRWARAFLLALDHSVNPNQSPGSATPDHIAAGMQAGLTAEHMTRLKIDDGNAGCAMGVVLALILLFGLLMAGVTLYFITTQMQSEPGDEAAGVIRVQGCPGDRGVSFMETGHIDELSLTVRRAFRRRSSTFIDQSS
jgi:uncharacterized protein (DUF983 family)